MNFNVDEFTNVMSALSTGNSNLRAVSEQASQTGRDIGSIVRAEDNALESQFESLANILSVLQGRVDMVVGELSQAFMEYMLHTQENQKEQEEELAKYNSELDSIKSILEGIERR